MKKALGVLLLLSIIFTFSTTAVYAEPAIIGSLKGSTGAHGDWEDGNPKEAEGDSLKIFYSGDVFGYVFENVPAGVYKIAHYFTVEQMLNGRQMRISPMVTMGDTTVRCWIDWKTSYTLQILSDAVDDEKGKFIFVSVIHVPKDGATINVGFWQDRGAYIGTCDKVVLATGDYDFKDNQYVLIDEKNYGDTTFNEDPDKWLFAEEGTWTISTSYQDAVAELGPAPTTMPTAATTQEPIPTPTEQPKETPTVTGTPAGISTGDNQAFPMGIIIVVVVVVIAAVAPVIIIMKKKKG